MILRYGPFLGEIPKVAAHLLPQGAAQTARHCKLWNGTLRPFRTDLSVATPAKVGTKQAIHLFAGQYWFSFLDEVQILRGPVAGDVQHRTYFSGDTAAGQPAVTDAAIAVQGTQYPVNWYDLGIPAPSANLSVAFAGAPTSTDPADKEDRLYAYSLVSAWGEEGPLSPPSATVEWRPGLTVDLAGFAAPVTGRYNLSAYRIYRTLAGEYKFLAEVPIAATAYNDAVPSAVLGEVCPSIWWYPPPATLRFIGVHPGSFLVGFAGNELIVSEAGVPHAYNPNHRLTTDYPIVGGGIFGQSILVLTTGTPYLATGATPDNLSLERIEINQACVSRRSIVDMGEAVGFASPDGYYMVGPGVARNLTEGLFDRDQWQALQPATMLAAFHDGALFLFHATGGFIVVPGEVPTKIDLGFTTTALHVDPVTDALYFTSGHDIVRWEGGSALRTARWKSRLERLPKPCNFGWGQIRGKDFPGTVRLYGDGTLRYEVTVASAAPFRLPGGYWAEEYEVETEGAWEVQEVVFAESIEELKAL